MKEVRNEEDEEQVLLKPPHNHNSADVVIRTETGIAARLDEAVQAAKPANRSSDLIPLSQEYDTIRKDIKLFVRSAKTYLDAMTNLDKARMDMTMQVSTLAKNTPIYDSIGNTTASNNNNNNTSLASIATKTSKLAQEHALAYQAKVVDYVVEWETVVTTRVDAEWKESRTLHKRLTHYQNKVDSLRVKIHNIDEKGRSPSKALVEKMKRNEDKLQQAWHVHERCSSKLCYLIEEVVYEGWKDLYPVVKLFLECEMERSCQEAAALAELSVVAEALDTAYFTYKRSSSSSHGTNHTRPVVSAALATITESNSESSEESSSSSNENKGKEFRRLWKAASGNHGTTTTKKKDRSSTATSNSTNTQSASSQGNADKCNTPILFAPNSPRTVAEV